MQAPFQGVHPVVVLNNFFLNHVINVSGFCLLVEEEEKLQC